MKKKITTIASALSVLVLFACSCSKDTDTSIAASQEKVIEALVSSLLSSSEGSYAVYNDGATRVVFDRGEGTDSLSVNGSATLYYAGFTIPSASISSPPTTRNSRKRHPGAFPTARCSIAWSFLLPTRGCCPGYARDWSAYTKARNP